ncbi:MAG TPA: hydantoinase/oxoprolinase family protein [Usitatibacter sp.]|nr:hydantoinase/oxoprolinase family protein [Usitatibacter sp.]
MSPNAKRKTPGELRVAVDTGGTFTDCVWLERGELRIKKVFSTAADPSQAIVNGVRELASGALTLLHGTTVGTNALLQRKGARVVLVTTGGFEDAIEIGRQNRPKLYDFFFERVAPLVAAGDRIGVNERMGPFGEVVDELKAEEVARVAREVAQRKPEAVAVCLLFSYANPAHEQALEGSLRELGAPLSLSHKILPEFREYERTSTVVVNAYLQPVMGRYLERLEKALTAARRIFVMQSSGGITALEHAAREPVRTVLSGPAGGVVGASAMARRSGIERIISFDMGGTSTDVALVDGTPAASNEADVAGLPVRVPMLDIHTIGAGGGSIARFDAAGALRVGPESAGAEPGPICYGKGTEPTVTDANLLLGRIPPDRFLGGEFTLDVERARRVLKEWLARQSVKMSLDEFAAGVVRVVNANMEKALRVVSIERGYDPREFTLVPFGGAGGLHACELAEALSIPRVLLPAMPGALSAYGILISDVVKDHSRTLLWEMNAQRRGEIEKIYRELEEQARAEFAHEAWKGTPRMQRSLDLRYRGQGFELNVPWGAQALAEFHALHERRYGYKRPQSAVELVTLRLRATLASPRMPHRVRQEKSAARAESRPVWDGKKLASAKILAREAVKTGPQRGPAVITEYSATAWVPPGWSYRADRAGNLIFERTKK